MRDLVFIRTHAFGENERSLYKTLRLFFPEEAVVVCADESKAQVDTGGIAKISLTRDIASRLAGGDLPEDWGWRMGDLFYARVREVHPDVGRYWLIEPDVHIPPGHVAAILGDLAEIEADYLACDFRDHGHRPFNRALRRIQDVTTYGGVFAFTRASAAAVKRTLALRQRVTATLGPAPPKVPVPNDEAVMANAVVAAGLTGLNLAEVMPEVFDTAWFSFNPPRLRRAVETADPDLPRVMHPILSIEEIAAKITAPSRPGYSPRYPAWRLRHVLPHLTPEERQVIEDAWAASDRH